MSGINTKTNEIMERLRQHIKEGREHRDPIYKELLGLLKDLDLLDKMLKQVALAYGWMYKSIKHNEDQLNEGNYSDDMKHAIIVKDILDIWREHGLRGPNATEHPK